MDSISRRQFLGYSSAFLSAPIMSSIARGETSKKPNFVFILVDDLGWPDLGCYGSSFYDTPNLDKLAASGMQFNDAYAACPVCSPTRAAIMAGKYPTRLNITDWIPGQDPKNRKLLGPQDLHQLPLDEVTLAETFKKQGYKTFFAGKWHLGDEGFFPEDQGFDINKGGHHRGSPPGGYYTPYKNPKLSDGPEGEYLTDRLTEESMSFMESNQDNPFLLYLSFYTVHTPIQACRRYIDHYKEKAEKLPELGEKAERKEHDGITKLRQDNPAYASMVRAMDENVGKVLNKLDELNLSENTVIIFTSDNGGLSTLSRRGYPTCNLPLRAGKGWCYEGGIRVPLIIRVPGITKPGSISNEPVISMDYYPTMLELAGLSPKPDQHCDGKNLVPLLKGEKELNREAIYWHYPHYHGSTWKPGAAIRARDWKLVEFYHEGKVELYNLKDDIGEMNDLSKSHPEKAKELLTMLRKWQKDTNAQMPKPNPNYKANE